MDFLVWIDDVEEVILIEQKRRINRGEHGLLLHISIANVFFEYMLRMINDIIYTPREGYESSLDLCDPRERFVR